jgi:hypothetical protein
MAVAGGMIGNAYGIKTPFEVAFVSFLLAATFAFLSLPYISPESMSDSKTPAKGGISGFLAPLKVLNPQKLRLESGALRKHYGVLFLCCGVFLGVVSYCYICGTLISNCRLTHTLSSRPATRHSSSRCMRRQYSSLTKGITAGSCSSSHSCRAYS